MFIINFFKIIMHGFYFLCSLLSRVFYFFPKMFFKLLKNIFKLEFFDKCEKFYEKRQKQPEFCLLIILYLIAIFTLIKIFYVKPQAVVKNDIDNFNDFIVQEDNENNINDDMNNMDNKDNVELDNSDNVNNSDSTNNSQGNSNNDGFVVDTNPFRNFAKTNLNDVRISELKKSNTDTVAWISVDGTTINYPIVQTSDNDYYLNHSFDKSYKKSGWTFMDYRNSIDMSDYNTIYYGHNLLNMTAFSSIANVFTDDWVKNSNHSIIVVTDEMQYVYKIFSAYYINPEVYYLQTVFYSDSDYQKFLNTLSSRNIINIDNSVSISDKIITLSTCTEDNKGRKVVHAKLVASRKRS